MRCGCVPRIFRRTFPLLTCEDTLPTTELTDSPQSIADSVTYAHSQLLREGDERMACSVSSRDDGGEGSVKCTALEEGLQKESYEEKIGQSEKKSFTARRNGPLFLLSFFKSLSSMEDPPTTWIRCECVIDEVAGTVTLSLRLEEDGQSASHHHKGSKSATIQSLFRIRGRRTKDEADMADLIRARRPSSTSAKTGGTDEEEHQPESSRPRERSMFCFGWGQTGVVDDDDDEAITRPDLITEAPPGLVGLMNLGNTCFLNAALQCLRCTPGFASLVVPELSEGFEGVVKKSETGEPCEKDRPGTHGTKQSTLRRLRNRSHSFSSLFHRPVQLDWDCTVALRSSSLPYPLPYEIGGRLEGETGLAGGSVLRLSSVPNLSYHGESVSSVAQTNHSNAQEQEKSDCRHEVSSDSTELHETDSENLTASAAEPVRNDGDLQETGDRTENAAGDRDHLQTNAGKDVPSPTTPTKNDPQPFESKTNQEEITEAEEEEEEEMEPSVDFLSAFQKLIMEVCSGEADHHRNPRDLYLQLKKLPQGEWFCDGGQHDCQEIFKVLLDTIHANYADGSSEDNKPSFGRCISDVTDDDKDAMHELELEILKANSLWRIYLSHDASPITDVFAGQLQIVRSCQKCHCRSTTYEPFWDLSLSLSREKPSWFNPGRMPGSLDDLMRAFTAAEVLQGEEAPYCDCCEQKSPATRRILIHRFPKVLVINIKRFKYTKDGREKLTSNIAFPVRALRLQNFASKEHQHEGQSEIYDLYAVSNHYGTLGGGHYTASCKVKDACGKDGWYSFNDKTVTKICEDMVPTPNAYILFYAMRLTTDSQNSSSS